MAINTRDRRFSVVGLSSVLQVFPTPDGAFDSAGDRLQLLGLYRGITAEPPVPDVTRGGYVETPAERRRRLARERKLTQRQLQRFREMSVDAVVQELREALEPPPAPETEPEQEARTEVQAAVEPFRQPDGGLDLATLVIEQDRLRALVERLSRLSVEMENREDEDAVALLLLMSQ